MTAPVAVVTGGSRGIGAAVCRRLAADGWDVVVGYRGDVDAAEDVAAEVRSTDGRRALAVRADVTDEAQVAALLDAADGFGPVAGLVTSAGAASVVGRLEDLPVDGIRRDLELDLLGTLLPIRAAIPLLRATRGAIVTISSGAATLGSAGEFVHYAAAKAGVDALTVGLSKELADDGIRVNAVAPGLVNTGFHLDPGRPARIAPTVPMRRAGEPGEIAAAVAWLLSPEASYTTGAILRVAGGR